MTVVMAGCGDLGTETALRFASLGHRVVGLRRSAEKLPAEVEGHAVDLAAEVPTLPADTNIVVIAMSPGERSVEAYRSAYVDTVVNVATAIGRDCTSPPRVLFVSSTAVYGIDDGRWIDDSTPEMPTSETAVVLREAEKSLLERVPGATVLRLAGIYGPGRNRLAGRIREGIETTSTQPHFTNRIHRDDAAAAIVHLMTMQEAPETVYIGVDDCPVDRREVVEFLAGKLNAPAPSLGSATADRGKRCHNTRLRDSGFVFEYPTYREGYEAILDGNGVRHP